MSNSLKQQSYNTIREKILNCEYAPNTYLNEKQLCEDLNVSRTPVRDALSRLEHENLVKILPKKGVLVSPLTINEINMIYETRILLEPYIIATYGRRITEETQRKMNETLVKSQENMDNIKVLFNLDDEFHQYIFNLCDNKYLSQCYSNIHAQNVRLRVISGNYVKKRLVATHNEHSDIVHYILKRDYEKAAKAMEAHLYASKDVAFKAIVDGNLTI